MQGSDELCDHFCLSNYSVDERSRNISLSDESFELLKILTCRVALSDLPAFLHLAYKLANSLQQNDRAGDAEICLELAQKVISRHFPDIDALSPALAAAKLGHINPKLPALYAAILHYCGKSYFYRHSISSFKQAQDFKEKEALLLRAKTLREEIDLAGCYEEPDDSGKGTFASHTTLFSRSLGYMYQEKGKWQKAHALYEKIFGSEKNIFERVMAARQAIHVYRQLTKEEWDPKAKVLLHQAAYTKVRFAEEYITSREEFSGLPGLALTIACFFKEKGPYQDIGRAQSYLQRVLSSSREYPLRLMIPIKVEAEKEIDLLEKRYHTSKISPLISVESNVEEGITLASLYRKKRQFYEAALILSNLLKVAGIFKARVQYELFLGEQELLQKELSFPAYLENLHQHHEALHTVRSRFNSHFTHDVIAILQKICKEALSSFDSPLPLFSLVALGSLARDHFSPYSDLEFVLVSEEKSPLLDQFSHLFVLKLLSLGETPVTSWRWAPSLLPDFSSIETKNGLMPDGGKMIPSSFARGFKLLGSPTEIVSFSSAIPFLFEMTQGITLFGSPDLTEALKREARISLHAASDVERKELFYRDMANYIPIIFKVGEKGELTYSPKHTLMRALLILLNHVEMHKEQQITPEEVKLLLHTLNCKRSSYYLKMGGQVEDFPFEEDTLENSIEPFKHAVEALVAHLPYTRPRTSRLYIQALLRSGQVDKVKDSSPETLGDIAMLRGDFETAHKYYTGGGGCRFKAAEAAIQNGKLAEGKALLDGLKPLITSQVLAQKVCYLRALLARKCERWQEALLLLEDVGACRSTIILAHGTLIDIFCLVEKGRIHQHLGNGAEALKALEIAKKLMERRYGTHHPFFIPIYRELAEVFKTRNVTQGLIFSEKAAKIEARYPELRWQGALDDEGLD